MDLESRQLIDVREPGEFASERIAGSRLTPLSTLDNHFDQLDRSQPMLIICKTGGRARKAAEKLIAEGFEAEVLDGGIDGWKAAGKPIEKGSRKVWAMDRQVRLGAGSMVLLGFGLYALVGPFGLLLSAFVGGGLVFSALTDTCAMASVLSRMPWNR